MEYIRHVEMLSWKTCFEAQQLFPIVAPAISIIRKIPQPVLVTSFAT